jgi:NAD(P)-dependent dehydrogenase (short-subunit alcohol dehydrogenase family)
VTTSNDGQQSRDRAWIVTGPTSGIGRRTALELAPRGTVVLVGRGADRLATVRAEIEAAGGSAIAVVADMSDIESVRRAAAQIVGLGLPIGGVLNNAGIMPARPATTPQGFDLTFATNHLGPLAFTDALVPHLPRGANVVFVASAAEDPAQKTATRAGFRGSRFISAEASARGEFLPGGSRRDGQDAYATSKQGNLAALFTLTREFPQLRFRAVDPGTNPSSGLSRDLPAVPRALFKATSALAPILPGFNTPGRAARLIARVLTDPSEATGVYYDERGRPKAASRQVSDLEFSSRYIAESRALLDAVGPVS